MAERKSKETYEELVEKEKQLNQEGKQLLFGDKVLKIRSELDMSQQDFADFLDIDVSNIKRWETRSKDGFKISLVNKLTEKTEYNANYLLGIPVDDTKDTINLIKEYTGLDHKNIQLLHEKANDYYYTTVLNLLFSEGFISRFINYIANYAYYEDIIEALGLGKPANTQDEAESDTTNHTRKKKKSLESQHEAYMDGFDSLDLTKILKSVAIIRQAAKEQAKRIFDTKNTQITKEKYDALMNSEKVIQAQATLDEITDILKGNIPYPSDD